MIKTLFFFFACCALWGCNIRAIAMVETLDAVYGKTTISKDQEYEPNKQDHPTFWETTATMVNGYPPSTTTTPTLPPAR